MTAAQRRRWSPQTAALLPRMEQAARRLHACGERPVFELLLELACEGDCLEDVLERVESLASLGPEIYRAIGADVIPTRRPFLVPAA